MAIAFVQAKENSGSGTSASVTLGSAPTAGNLLIAAVMSQAATAPTLAGWTALTSVATGTGTSARAQQCFYKIAGAGESATVTSTVSNTGWEIAVCEYSGIDTTTPLLVENAVATASSTTHTSPTVTPTAGIAALIFCAVSRRTTGSANWSSEKINASATGVTDRADVTINDVTTTSFTTCFDRIDASTTGSYSGAATTGSAVVGAAAIAIFQAANANVTRALTGSAATAGAGALGPAHDTQVTGQTSTASAGTVPPAHSNAMVGQAATGSAGTLAPSTVVPLIGSVATALAGTLTVATSDVTVALAGSAAAASAGTAAPAHSNPLAGQAATASPGILGSGRTVPLAGAQATGQAGTLTASVGSNNVTVALSGTQASAQAGTLVGIVVQPQAPVVSGGSGGGSGLWLQGDAILRAEREIEKALAKHLPEKKPAEIAKPEPPALAPGPIPGVTEPRKPPGRKTVDAATLDAAKKAIEDVASTARAMRAAAQKHAAEEIAAAQERGRIEAQKALDHAREEARRKTRNLILAAALDDEDD